MTTDISGNNGPTYTVSQNSPLLDLLNHYEETDPSRTLLIEDLTNYTALVEDYRARAVWSAREKGETWETIGRCLGVSKQAAQQRYGS